LASSHHVLATVLGFCVSFVPALSFARDHWEAEWDDACARPSELRAVVDGALAQPVYDLLTGVNAPVIPGISMAVYTEACGEFLYAAGLQDVAANRPLTPATPMRMASQTKLLITAILFRAIEEGYFGDTDPNVVLSTTIDHFLDPLQVELLTVGCGTDWSTAPLQIYGGRGTDPVFAPALCPDFSEITLRHLLNANHGMVDWLNESIEFDLWFITGAFFTKYTELVYDDWFVQLGVPAMFLEPRPEVTEGGFDHLRIYGLSRYPGAVVGGLGPLDIEPVGGNTGFQLAGIILENVTSRSLPQLVDEFIVEPLDLDPIFFPSADGTFDNKLAHGYIAPYPGVEPTSPIAFNGHMLADTADLAGGRIEFIGGQGGAGGGAATMRSYEVFLDAFYNGDLLSPEAMAELEGDLDDDPATPGSRIPWPGLGPWEDTAGVDDLTFALGVWSGTGFFPDMPEVRIEEHPGGLPGVSCSNRVYKEPGRSPISTSICYNLRPYNFHPYLGFPWANDVANDVFRAVRSGIPEREED